MFRRLFWLTIGVVVGILLWRKVTKVAHAYSPDGLAERAQAGAQQAGNQFRSFVDDVRQLADARETELRAALTDNRPVREPGTGRRRGDGRELRAKHAMRAANEERSANRHGD